MMPQRPHLRRAHPGDPARRSSAPRCRLGDEDTVAKLPEGRSGAGRRGSAGLGARAAAAPCLFLPPFSPEQGTLGKARERLALGSLLCALSLTAVDFHEEDLIMFCTACLPLRFNHNADSYLYPTLHLSLKWFSE